MLSQFLTTNLCPTHKVIIHWLHCSGPIRGTWPGLDAWPDGDNLSLEFFLSFTATIIIIITQTGLALKCKVCCTHHQASPTFSSNKYNRQLSQCLWSSHLPSPKTYTPIMNYYTVVIEVMNFLSVLHFLDAGPVVLVITTFMCQISWNLGASTSWNPLELNRPEQGLLYLLPGNAAVFKLDAGSGLTSFLTLFPVLPEEKKVLAASSSAVWSCRTVTSTFLHAKGILLSVKLVHHLWLMDAVAGVSFVLWSGVLGLVVCGLGPSIRLSFK